MLSSSSDKAQLFAKKNPNLAELGISLLVSPSRTNWKLHNIYVTPKMIKKVITNLSSEEYQVNAGVPQGLILGPTLFLLIYSLF